MPLIRHIAVLAFAATCIADRASAEVPPVEKANEAKTGEIRMLRPDLILQSLASPESPVRREALIDLGRCYAKNPSLIPGAIQLLRRSANDPAFDVSLAAVEAAGLMGTAESFLAIADVLRAPHTPAEAAKILDAIDSPSLRPFWKSSDPYRVSNFIDNLNQKAQRQHTLADLEAITIPEPTPGVISSGREAFRTARCDACHRVAGYGRATGPDLRGIGMCYSNTELIRHILQPSLDLHDVGRFEKFLLSDGRVITGRAASTDQSQLRIQTDLSNPESVVTINAADIEQRQPSKVSPMPVGLLNSLTPTQVAELVVYLRSDGGRLAPPAASHEH
ncbi:c-type cytochrome [Rhodopirellula bahusiensis]|uniref:Heme-binding protein n=1 Tax=Rhodopirellula bahusiensis TaxID=2014065 RepID=A0A2G1WBU3_9BACT|nr:c-type cytochrome [Rhodopirellula bahusiensis]PHQ36508.1 heme-binding protein [Rhodopirellula bahusiensis]